MDDFTLTFELTDGVGSARARVSVGGIAHETDVSYLTRDPLGQLAQVLIEHIQETTVFVFGTSESEVDPNELAARSFTWEDEPGGWRWILRPHDELPAEDSGARQLRTAAVRVRLEVLGSATEGPPLIEAICSLREMARALVDCFEKPLLTHGIVGYRTKWVEGDLPLSQYLILERWLRSQETDPAMVENGTWHEDLAMLVSLASNNRWRGP
jgi:hypothetical protein